VDAATPAERQKFVFDKILEILKMEFEFENKEMARKTIFEISDLFRNWNYAATDSEDYQKILAEIESFIVNHGEQLSENEKSTIFNVMI